MNVRRKRNHSRQRGLHIVLAAALCINLLAGPALATTEDRDGPIAPSQAQPGDRPVITLQGNAVTEYGKPTGFFELAVNVKTPDKPSSERAKTFRSVDLTLMFDPTILTPVTWDTDTPIDLAGTTGYSVQLDTKKADNISSAYAVTDESGKLVFSAKTLRDVSFPEETTIAVLRFQYDLETYALLQDDPDAAHFVYPNPEQWKSADAHWPAAPGGTPQPKRSLVWFAPDADAAGGLAGQSIWYESGQTEFYYCTALKGDGTPDTAGKIVTAYGSADPVGSTTTNLLTAGTKADETDIRFEFINYDSYVNKGVDLGNLSTILFYDWDDTLIGVLTVPKHVDVRDRVNEYVEANMVHPQLRGDAAKAAVGSTARADSYRGKYPYSGPNGNTDEMFGDDAGVNSDGASLVGGDYPLTNKLDYTFFKREMKYVKADDPAVELDPAADQTGKWVQAADDTTGKGLYDAEFPYVNGWARCPSAQTVEDTWTTLGGTGELSDYAVDAASQTASFTVADNMAFDIVDFEQGLTDATVYVKALYEPGDLLKSLFAYKTVENEPYYTRYGVSSTVEGGTYSVQFHYERATTDGYGVGRIREPAVRMQITPDLMGAGVNNAKSSLVYVKVEVENTDVMTVDLTPASGVNSVGYCLTDGYNATYITGSVRSGGGELNELAVPYNFNYDRFGYDDRLGSEGLVTKATLAVLLQQATLSVKGDANTFESHAMASTLTDVNLCRNANGDKFSTSLETANGQKAILAAVREAYARGTGGEPGWIDSNGDVSLNWHQLQHYILTSELLSADAADAVKYSWCRIHQECAGGADAVVDFESLLRAAANYDSNPAALDALMTGQINGAPIHLRADGAGAPYTSVETFKQDIIAAVNNAPQGDYTKLTWDQVQYYIDKGAYSAEADAYGKAHYWWFNGGAEVTDIPSLMQAAVASGTGRTAALDRLDAAGISDEPLYLRADLEGASFTVADFRSAIAALATAAGDTALDLTWDQVQYYLIHPTLYPADIGSILNESKNQYWWFDGNDKISDLKSLLSAVALAKNSDDPRPAVLNSLTAAVLYDAGNTELHFRADFGATHYNESTVDSLKDKLLLLGEASGYSTQLTWNQVQYYLIHDEYIPSSDIMAMLRLNTEAKEYYWWKEGRDTPPVIDLVQIDVSTLIDAAYRAVYNGNTAAWDDPDLDTPEEIRTLFHLVAGYDPAATSIEDMTLFTDLDVFRAEIVALVQRAVTDGGQAGEPVPDVPTLGAATKEQMWLAVQHWLITGDSYDFSGLDTSDSGYWWYGKEILSVTELDKLLAGMYQYAEDGTDFTGTVTRNYLNSTMYFKRTSGGLTFGLAASQTTLAKTALRALATQAWSSPYNVGGKFQLTWYQIQRFIIESIAGSGPDITSPDYAPAAALDMVKNTWGIKAPVDMEPAGVLLLSAIPPEPLDVHTVEEIVSPDGCTVTTVEKRTTSEPETGCIVTETVTTAVTTTSVEGEGGCVFTTVVTTVTVTTTTVFPDNRPPETTTTSETSVVAETTLKPESGEPEKGGTEAEGAAPDPDTAPDGGAQEDGAGEGGEQPPQDGADTAPEPVAPEQPEKDPADQNTPPDAQEDRESDADAARPELSAETGGVPVLSMRSVRPAGAQRDSARAYPPPSRVFMDKNIGLQSRYKDLYGLFSPRIFARTLRPQQYV